MHRVDLSALRADSSTYDQAVSAATDIDQFCSSADWILPAHDALMPAREALLFRDSDGWLALARGQADDDFVYLEPLEASWGLAAPIVGASAEAAGAAAATLEWDVFLVTGVLDGSETQRELMGVLARQFSLRRGAVTTRFVADLSGGVDAFLALRSRRLRRTLRRDRKRASSAGVRFDVADTLDPSAAYNRICAIENTTWKGESGVGFVASGMGAFYRQMMVRLSRRGALRLRFGRLAERDVSYVLGGLFSDSYRGLQFGYAADCAHLGLGNLSQLDQIEALCGEGVATYDLGTTGSGYKRRWADREVTSTALIALRG